MSECSEEQAVELARLAVEAWLRKWEVPGVDPGVRKLVALLRAHGFNTTDSGDGVSKDLEEHECALPFANVFIRHDDPATLIATTDRLTNILTDLVGGLRDGQSVEASYSTHTGSVIAVVGVTDKDISGS